MLENTAPKTLYRLQELLIGRATGEIPGNDGERKSEYASLRTTLLQQATLKPNLVPSMVKECFSLDMYWLQIKEISDNYQGRRKYIYEMFAPAFHALELNNNSPADQVFSLSLSSFDFEDVSPVWQKALERRISDPEGAITLARSLVELTCKKILQEMGDRIEGNDLPMLYRTVASKLNLSPGGHSEQIFKQILGNCQAIVESLAAIRNRHSDAHGQTKTYKPAARHAELAVNLAGTMTTFLVTTWNERKET